ncbi:ATP-binding protein [Pseudomonas sp. GD03842]|uniref:sensor histidine kinase n=1 Tax=unclassified Pseudomonas TaxID=196821 RepID=UPI000D3BBBA7|nr:MULTISPECIES: hybrid sensor histidine kinase/response regulator [unclassified Pseudomonas]MDH0748990.1 ATP-binding protein [Pseudomonas sp. GD03842]RAU42389.1 hybrid sensor histidine kinase/response regulator [Pseudomonas sp. RIT 409]RAU50680.1 hybrid sensor histidine kinase/response regulator [Pseudomonas sp. RIT 412]
MRFLLIGLLMLVPMLVSAVDFNEDTRNLPLGPATLVYEDPTGAATIEEVASPQGRAKFQALNASALNAGYSRSAYWLKVDLTYRPLNPVAATDWLLELAYPPMDHVDLYLASEGAIPSLTWQTGDTLPFSSRQIRQNNYLFDLDLKPHDTKTAYIRVASHGSLQAPLNLWASHAYIEEQPSRFYILGMIYGVLAVMLVYNLFIYLSVRDTSYLYYILYIVCFGLYQVSVNGAGIEYFWPDNPWWANTSTTFLMAAALLFASQFARKFLQTPRLGPWLDVPLVLTMVCAAIIMVLALCMDYGIALRLVTALVLVFTPVILLIGVVAWLRGRRVARYFIVAWSAFLLGGVVNATMLLGHLPNNFWTMYASQIGSVVEVALLSLALADRINTLRERQAQIMAQSSQDLEKLNQQLAVSNRLKDEFLATLTHELRTPMNGVIGSLELMQMESDQDEIELYRQTAADSAQNMMGIVNGILTLTELQARRIAVQNATFSLRHLLFQVRSTFEPLARDKSLALNIEIDETLPDSLHGDALRLRQCLDCLLDNAIKFTKAGSIRVRVSGHVINDRDVRLVLDVIDTGIGFARLDEETLYANFYQVDGSMTREYGGLGIGLAICRQLIELQGGRLSHQSEPGNGSQFRLSLDVQRAALPVT